MVEKNQEKEKAINFRREGLSYSEILKKVPVAKSTLSLWLRNIGLAVKQKQRLTEKRLAAAKRGGIAKRNYRQAITEQIKSKARLDLKSISGRELWLIGIALYWAEGHKAKENNPSVRVRFTNSDPLMIKVYLKWLEKICKISLENIDFEIYIHETANIEKAKEYWPQVLNVPKEKFQKIRLKRNKIRTKRKNIGENYHGLLSIIVKRSTNLNREISGWIEGIVEKII